MVEPVRVEPITVECVLLGKLLAQLVMVQPQLCQLQRVLVIVKQQLQ